jgi:hypothetical protein
VRKKRGKGAKGRVQTIDGIRTRKYEVLERERRKIRKNLISTSTLMQNNQELKVHDPSKQSTILAMPRRFSHKYYHATFTRTSAAHNVCTAPATTGMYPCTYGINKETLLQREDEGILLRPQLSVRIRFPLLVPKKLSEQRK